MTDVALLGRILRFDDDVTIVECFRRFVQIVSNRIDDGSIIGGGPLEIICESGV
jgi:hypothetical protein